MGIEDFKRDIQSGKIKAMAMLGIIPDRNDIYKSDFPITQIGNRGNDPISNNKEAQMFLVKRRIKNVYDDYFTLQTYYNDGTETECEAYYNAFTKYTGNSVSNGRVFYQVFEV